MCLKQDVEYYSSNKKINDLPTEWPIRGKNRSKLVVACNNCFYPITFEEHIIHEIKNDINISLGIVIPLKKLFRKVGIFGDNPLDQWRTEAYCLNCGTILSFLSTYRHHLTDTNFEKIKHYINLDEKIIILWTTPLFRGSAIEAKNRFEQVNEF